MVEISGSGRETADVDTPTDWRLWSGLATAGSDGAVEHSEAKRHGETNKDGETGTRQP